MRIPLLLASLALPASAQSVWTVDDDGPADFAEIQDALLAAAPNDVLLVAPGSYAQAMVTQRVRIYGDPDFPRPLVSGIVVNGASSVDLAHLRTTTLSITDVDGRMRVDDCVVTSETVVEDADQLVVTRSELTGQAAAACGKRALWVKGASGVQVVDCVLEGGFGWTDTVVVLSGWGGDALYAEDTSRVWVVGSTLTGGDGEDYDDPWGVSDQEGLGGDGAEAREDAEIDLRGNPDFAVTGGLRNFWDPASQNGRSLFAWSGATIEWSGAALSGAVVGDVTEAVPASPFLYVRGDDGPNEQKRLSVFGEPGDTAFVVGSLDAAFLELPTLLDVPIWLDAAAPFEVLTVPLVGNDDAATHVWTLPATITPSIVYHVQGVVPTSGGALVGTNSANIVFGH